MIDAMIFSMPHIVSVIWFTLLFYRSNESKTIVGAGGERMRCNVSRDTVLRYSIVQNKSSLKHKRPLNHNTVHLL